MKNQVKFIAIICFMAITIAVKAQSTDEIIAKHQAAMGSPEKWESVKSMVMKNKFSVQGMDIESKTSVLVGKSFRTEIEVMGNKIVTVIDGESGWMNRWEQNAQDQRALLNWNTPSDWPGGRSNPVP